jgi:hypothetical protein
MSKKASTAVVLTTLVALSLGTAACSSGPNVTADCVVKQPNGQLKAVDDRYCDKHQAISGVNPVWVYGGSSHSGYVSGSSYSKPAGANITSRSGTVISRGGLGGRAGSGS